MKADHLAVLDPSHIVESLQNVFFKPGVKSFFSFIVIMFNWLIGANQEAFFVVFALVVLDTITGFVKAVKLKDVSSGGFFRFATKCFVYFILICTASLVDKIVSMSVGVSVVYTFLGITEAISILENCGQLGIALPPSLINILKAVQNKNNQKK